MDKEKETKLTEKELEAVSGGNMWGMTDEEYEVWRLKFLEKLDAKSKGNPWLKN